MRRTKARIEAFTLEPAGEPGVRLACDAGAVPGPGQAALALLPGSGQALRHVLFSTHRTSTGFTTDRPPEPGWRLGDELDLLGPVGRGFSPPDGARRWFLASLGRPASRLMPLIDLGLTRGAAVSLWTRHPPPGLPSQVELTPDPGEALAWSDYLALEIAPETLPRLRQFLFGYPDLPLRGPDPLLRGPDLPLRGPASRRAGQTPVPLSGPNPFPRGPASRRAGQVLIAPPMPCGLGTCGACHLKAKRGWRCACTDGPVFDLDELEW
jgi:dihydroorotate dehydrogenase electron transfer subunit